VLAVTKPIGRIPNQYLTTAPSKVAPAFGLTADRCMEGDRVEVERGCPKEARAGEQKQLA